MTDKFIAWASTVFMDDVVVPFPSWDYLVFFLVLFGARSSDFLSTWIATPNLVLEGNPLAKKLGWKFGLLVNLLLCGTFALLPLAAIIISTTSVLVAARNFQNAWLMRSLGEEGYRQWYVERLQKAHFGLYLFCLFAQTSLYAAIGAALAYYSVTERGILLIPFAIGLGVLGYAFTVLFYTLLSVWNLRSWRRRAAET